MMKQQKAVGHLSVEQFLQEYWQKKPVWLKGVYAADFSAISPDELAGLSLEEEIDARIVIHDPKKNSWTVEHGPFADDRFSTLKKENWTLLVQGVDHWEPQVAALRDAYAFIPQWRFDDVMVSYAVKGGGVGPHLDQYDVFLIQGLGRRRWLVGDKDQAVDIEQDVTALKQIKPYAASMDVIVEPGDVLYIPPNTPHWGIAMEECLTYSVGFRAPSATDILSRYTEYLIDSCIDGPRFADPDWRGSADLGEIPRNALDKMTLLLQQSLSDTLATQMAFAQLVTQTRYPLEREGRSRISEAKLKEQLAKGKTLSRVADARCAWFCGHDGKVYLFANGSLVNETIGSELARFLCNVASIDAKDVEKHVNQFAIFTVLTTLVNRGAFTF